MPKLTCLIPGRELEDAKEDFRAAQKVEQYRLGTRALYLPRGLSWEYIPLEALDKVERSHRIISAGHCVTVREEKPAVDLTAGEKQFTLNLEKQASVRLILQALKGEET